MAKRLVQECDLCKQEYDPDETQAITVKKKGKTKANAFDLCSTCAAKIQRQLVAESSAALDINWTFDGLSKLAPGITADELRAATPARGSRREEITAEQQADNDLIASKDAQRRAELAEAGIEVPQQVEAREVPYETVDPTPLDDGGCPHMNRGPIRPVNGQFQQECRDCGEALAPNTSSERNGRPTAPAGVNLSTHASDRRNRD